jgi:hypothetical protein
MSSTGDIVLDPLPVSPRSGVVSAGDSGGEAEEAETMDAFEASQWFACCYCQRSGLLFGVPLQAATQALPERPPLMRSSGIVVRL